MAGIAAMLPGLLSSAASSGVISKAADFAGNVLKDIAEGKVGSWGDFGKSLAAGGARALGVGAALPLRDSYPIGNDHERKMAEANIELLRNSKNAADQHVIMTPMESEIVRPQMPKFVPFQKREQREDYYYANNPRPYPQAAVEVKRDPFASEVPVLKEQVLLVDANQKQLKKHKEKKKKFKKIEHPLKLRKR